MRKADLMFVASITMMSCLMMYAMHTKSITLFAIAEVGCLLDIIAYWRYNKRQ
jgi:hypothetical protein